VGSGGVAAGQGTSVSLTADGNTAFVAGSSDRNSIGAVWTWTRTAGEWRQQGTKLVGSGVQGGSLQGSSVSLSADGSTAIVGGTGDNGFAGAAWVWIRNAGVWSEQAKLVASDALGDAQQGQSVSLSADGNTAIVGGSADHDYTGAAWVWTRSAGVWSEQAKLVSSDAVGKGWQGLSVSLSADGNTAIVGGPGRHVCRVCSSPVDVGDSSSDGAAWIWTRTDGIWTPQAKLFAPDAFPFSRQGLVVALSADGKTAITVSEYGAWFWTKSAGTWIQQSPRVDASGAATLSALGNTAVIGVHVWNRSGASWTSENTVLSGSDAVGAAGQGASVSLSADGNTVVIGGPYDNTIEIPSPHRLASPYRYYIGATWVWRRNQGVWKQLGSKLFGWGVEYPMQGGAVAISLDGSTILIGGTDDDHGAVGSSWIFSALTPSSPKKRAVAQ
jgi:hypothetical protein